MATEIRGLDRLNGALSRFINELGLDAETQLKQTARQLAGDFMEKTPPFIERLGVNDSATTKTKAGKDFKGTGIASIRHDLLNVVTPTTEVFDQAFKNKYVEKLIKNKNVEGLQALADKSKLKGWKVIPFASHLHERQRNRGGRYRVPKSLRQMTFDERELKRYQKSLEKRIGYSKAGWGFTVAAMGGKVLAWISRHFSYCKGDVKLNTQNTPNPSIEFSNSTPNIRRYINLYNYAIQVRADLMLNDFNKKVEIALQKQGLK